MVSQGKASDAHPEMRNLMTTPDGDAFYPDNVKDAALFHRDHGAWFPNAEVTLIIPHIPTDERAAMLERAVLSVQAQTIQPAAVLLMTDTEREGASVMRNRALERVETPWVAFLDDDDALIPHHLETLLLYAHVDLPGDVFYPICRVFDKDLREIPRHMEWGRAYQDFDADLLRQKSYIPVTSLVRTEFAKRSQFKAPEGSYYDDWGFYLGMLEQGAQFVHVPIVTWLWYHHGANTQGRSDLW
jgi:glycosyltransferase involved in cell wall biosynthesis